MTAEFEVEIRHAGRTGKFGAAFRIPDVLLLHFEGVSRLMILDLEREKAVDSSNGLGVLSGYSQLRAALRILRLICDLAFQPLHRLYTWGHRGMDKHRNIKIALGEFYRDHRQMPTDGLLASCIGGLVALYLDSTAVSQKTEMMSCFLVTKAHALIATGIYAGKIVFVTRRRLLGDCAQVRRAEQKQEKEAKNLHLRQRSSFILSSLMTGNHRHFPSPKQYGVDWTSTGV
jgi:hypothetical protein